MEGRIEGKGREMTLLEQRESRVERGFYWESQIAFVYNSEKMEGNPLTEDQTRAIFETGTVTGRSVPLRSAIETMNHFKMFDLMLDTLDEPLTKGLMRDFHRELKRGLDDSGTPAGEWKRLDNSVGGISTARPKDVDREVGRLLDAYGNGKPKTLGHIASFHWLFECIHPFQDGNGRVGRMIAFRECIANDIVPFIVLDETKDGYYRGLRFFQDDPSLLESYFARMQERYVDAFASLLPEDRLLPALREASERARGAELDFDQYFAEQDAPAPPRSPSADAALAAASALAQSAAGRRRPAKRKGPGAGSR